MNLDHAHNEWLDMFARRGLVGVAFLAGWLLIPIFIFYPRRRRNLADSNEAKCMEELTIRVTGILLSVSFIGFGLTQVLFSHNSGHMMYLFGLVLWSGAFKNAHDGVLKMRLKSMLSKSQGQTKQGYLVQ
jgi:O-antigen ligase